MTHALLALGGSFAIFLAVYFAAYVGLAETTGGGNVGVTRTYSRDALRRCFVPAAALEAKLLDHWVVLDARDSEVIHGFPPPSFEPVRESRPPRERPRPAAAGE